MTTPPPDPKTDLDYIEVTITADASGAVNALERGARLAHAWLLRGRTFHIIRSLPPVPAKVKRYGTRHR